LSHPGAADAVDTRRVEFLSATWERIQITLRLRPVDGQPLDPAAVRLRRISAQAGVAPHRLRDPGGSRGQLTEPARAWLEGDIAVVRINVMQGPEQEPLEAGRWVLVLVDGTQARPVVAVNQADHGDAAAAFTFGTTRYSARPMRDASRAVGLEIRIQPADQAAAGVPSQAILRRLLRPFRRLRLGLFAILYRIFHATSRRTGRRILFTSDSRSELGGNLKIVHDRMVERGLDRDYELQTLFKESIGASRGFRDRLRLPRLLARADVIVIDDYQPVIYRFDDPTKRVVQLWHAWGAFKTVGYSRVGKPGGLDPYSRVHKTYTHAIVSSEAEVPFYAEAFGIPESRVYPTGIPRMDRFRDPARAAASREAALDAYPAARDRTVYLFAPTFRGHGARTAWYDVSQIDYPALHALCVDRDAVCIIRMHPFVRAALDIPTEYADRIIDGSTSSIDINDVLFATDVLITDYSSVVFEFSTMDRPMLFFAYDLESYIGERDFYVRYEDFVPGRIVRTFDAVLDAIRTDDFDTQRLAAFRARHLGRFDGRATDRVIDLIIGR